LKSLLRVFSFFLTILLASPSYSQQQPWYSQYILNNFIINPALAGIENYWDIKGSYRNQWIGLEGAPVTMYLTAQGILGNPNLENETVLTAHPLENTRGYNYWENYQVSPSHLGLGFTVIQDKTGPLNNLSAKLSGAYHVKLSSTSALSFGLSLGIQQESINASLTYFGNQSPADPSIYPGRNLNKIKPELDAGLWLYSGRYFLGFSAQQLISQSLNFSGSNSALSGINEGRLVPHLFLQGGYKFLLGNDFSLLPSTTVKLISPSPTSFDLNLKALYRDFLWLGITLRDQNQYAVMVGFNTKSGLNFGYSYDFGTSPLYTIGKGTHEIVLGLLLRNHLRDRCPRNIW
jgi:type IX secretion system PorP/SprF family membrane protein